MPEEKKNASMDADINVNKAVAALSYAWILCLVPLLGKRKSKFAQFHAKQGFILFLISFVSWFPFFGQLFFLALTVVCVMGIIKALNGEWWKVPFIYEWSKKIKF